MDYQTDQQTSSLESHRDALSPDAAVPPPPPSPLRRTFFGADGLRAGWSLLLYAALILLVSNSVRGLFHLVHRHDPDQAMVGLRSPLLVIFGDGVPFLAVLFVVFLMSRIERRPLATYGIGATPRALPQLLAGLAWGALLLAVLVGTLVATHLLVFTGFQLSGGAIIHYGVLWALAFFCVGLFEEYALRGYVQFTVARGLAGLVRFSAAAPYARIIGFWIAAAFFSFIFGFGHKNNVGESPLGLVSAGLIGLVFCLSLWRTGSLWWAIGFHAAWDWAQSFVFGVADSGHMVAFHMLASHPQGRPLLSGGLTGPEGSIYVLPVILLVTLSILLTLRHTGWPTPGTRTPSLEPGTLPRDAASR